MPTASHRLGNELAALLLVATQAGLYDNVVLVAPAPSFIISPRPPAAGPTTLPTATHTEEHLPPR
jgi:hypothetical protein